MSRIVSEFAGKDSVAAHLRYIQDDPHCEIIPSVVFTRTEYGDFDSINKSVDFVKSFASCRGAVLNNVIVVSNEPLWNLLCARYQYNISQKYGFYTPCIMCHLFTHLMRIPILLDQSTNVLLTGERLYHNSKIKLNQHEYTLDCFSRIFQNIGVKLVRPLYFISDNSEIDNIIKDRIVISEANNVKCVLSGNLDGDMFLVSAMKDRLKFFVDCFLYPVGKCAAEALFYKISEKEAMRQIEGTIMECLHG